MLSKPETYHDERRLDWVRAMNCVVCGATPPVEAHHVMTGGVGIKCSDRLTIPLCHRCHRLVQTHMWDELAQRWAFGELDVWRACALIQERWAVENEEGKE